MGGVIAVDVELLEAFLELVFIDELLLGTGGGNLGLVSTAVTKGEIELLQIRSGSGRSAITVLD